MYGMIINGVRKRIQIRPVRTPRGESAWSAGEQESDPMDRILEAVDRKLQEIQFRAESIFQAAMRKQEDE